MLMFSFAISGAMTDDLRAESAKDDVTGIPREKLKFELLEQSTKVTPPAKPAVVANPLNFPYVPVPRYKPGTHYASRAAERAKATIGAIETNQRGQMTVALNRLARERNQKTARELRPTLKSTWTSGQIAEARKRCNLVLATTNIDAKQLEPLGGAGGCGIASPLLVSAFGAIKVNPPAKLNCNMALATYKWLTDRVQPMARKKYRMPVVAIRQLSSFSCRSRRGSGTSRISEHSFGNALDIASFTLANGKKISVLKDWSTTGALFGIGRDANFLFDAHAMACKSFATVLSPRYNKAHANHFHMDLGRGGRYKICK